jgi:predicted permease
MHWLIRLLRREQNERQLDAELRFHLEKQIAQNRAAGMSHEEARRCANLQFGGIESLKQQAREARRGDWLDGCYRDVLFTLRTLRKSPGFAAVAILTLALGIGANTALFSLLNGLVLRDLAVPHPEQLVRFGLHPPDEQYSALSLPIFQEIARRQTAFSKTFAWWGDAIANVETDGALSRANTWGVDGEFFSELAATPEIGRLFGSEEVNLDGTPEQIVVLGRGFWQRHYGGAADVLGRTLKIEGVPFRIIGVAREGFTAFSADNPPEVIIPLNAEPLLYEAPGEVQKHLQRRQALWIEGAGRLKQGVTLAQARAQLEALWLPMQSAFIPTDKDDTAKEQFRRLRLKVESGARGESTLRERFTRPLYVVLGISALVLLLACMNLASLTLARAAARSQEMAARVALGASRWRLIRQMLAESLTLAVAGTVVGFLFADWAGTLLASFILKQAYLVPASLNLSPDLRVFSFTAVVAVATGILVGMAPAWRASNEDPHLALQRSARGSSGGTGRLGPTLIIAQVALSLVLLAGAGLFARSIANLRNARPGFRTEGLIAAGLFPRPNGYKDLNLAGYHRELLERVSQLPGIESAGLVRMTPGGGFEWKEQVRIAGSAAQPSTIDFVMLEPGSFRPLGIELLQGRALSWQDHERAARVAIVSKSLAAAMFPDCNPVSAHLELTVDSKWQTVEIVGVASDASYYDLRKHSPLTIYVPTAQYGDAMGYNDLVVQTAASPAALGDALRGAVDSFGHEYIFSMKTVAQLIGKTFLQERVTAMLAAFFGGLALIIAAIGLYGQTAYSVARRTREIGIRIALGADRGRVQRMVLREALALAIAGASLGVTCAAAASRFVATLLFGLSPRDPGTLTLAVFVLLVASALAAYFPARRAMGVDPIIALRNE